MKSFQKYLELFERDVLITGLEKGRFGKTIKVATKECKLNNTEFGKFIGCILSYNEPMAIDYYGLVKKSSGMLEIIEGYRGIEIKTILLPVVHFASVKNEDINALAPSLLQGFSSFKEYLIHLRGFNRGP